MGCRQSRDDTELIKYCRERKHLIKASRNSLCSLARVHKEYLQSLQNLDNEIRNFVGEALTICFKLPSEPVPVHQNGEDVTQPKDSPLEPDKDDVLSVTDVVHRGSDLSHAESETETEISASAPLEPSVPPTNVTYFTEQPYNGHSDNSVPFFLGSIGLPQTKNIGFFTYSDFDFPGRNYSLDDNFVHSMPSSSALLGHGSWESYNQQKNYSFNYVNIPSDSSYPAIPEWDFLSPFTSTEKCFPNLYFQGRYDTNFRSDSIDYSKVREEEGIPDLEDEVHNPKMDTSSGEGVSELKEKEHCHLSEEVVNNVEDVIPDKEVAYDTNLSNHMTQKKDQEGRSSSSPSESLKPTKIDNLEPVKEHEESKDKEMMEVEANDTDVTEQEVTFCSTDVQEVLRYVKSAFDTILIHGKDVLEMLEPYQPPVTLINRASLKGTSLLRSVMLRRRAYRKLKYDQQTTSTILPSLSWTLEKLYIWEDKLYNEVKDEEKLRVIFDKERLKLKKLDHRGAESVKIDACQSSLRKLTPRMDVSLSKIQGISRAMYQISINELQTQLCEFVRRMHKMSKLSYLSHQRQVQAISKCHANIDTITCITSTSSQAAAEKLETEIVRLEANFMCWTTGHKEFVLLFKKWLAKFEEEKEVSDLNASSPAKLLTPNAFTICAEWLTALEKVSEVQVLLCFENTAFILHQVADNLEEERCQRQKMQYLTSYIEKKLKRFCRDSGIDWDQYATVLKKAEPSEDTSGNSSLDAFYASLRPVRNKLQEADGKHKEAMKQLHDTAARIFQHCLVPLLEALQTFNMEMYKAYEQVINPNQGSVQ